VKLKIYELPGCSVDIRPAEQARAWMTGTTDSFANRCLPLLIANQHGWEVRCQAGFEAKWDSRADMDAITITPEAGIEPGDRRLPLSHFGHGVLTFHVDAVIRTDPGYNLIAMGPPNAPKDGIAPLMGIMEADWMPFSFTMNWLFTTAETPVRFERGEPFCFLFPVPRALIEEVEPEFAKLDEDPELYRQFQLWSQSRESFIKELKIPDSSAVKQRWQKVYFRGEHPDGETFEDHQTKLAVKAPKRPF
jgi:Family of unknown function (DUF6065)